VLDILASHPSTARFIATKLARRFVSDTPPESLVARAAARFTATDGNIAEVVRTIVTSPEFFAPDARNAKFKTPLEFVVSAVRTSGDRITETRPLLKALRDLGMPLYMCQPPTRLRRHGRDVDFSRRSRDTHQRRAADLRQPHHGHRLAGIPKKIGMEADLQVRPGFIQ
jgi:uncharacterized protein (DUF1800 family)